MNPRTRRILRWLTILTLLLIVLVVTGYVRLRQTPAFYRLTALTAAELSAAADRIEQKLVIVQNAAAQSRADEAAARKSSTTLPTNQPIMLTVTQDEINAFLQKWSVWPTLRDQYAKYLQEPYIALEDDQLILAGKIPSVDTVLSVHFHPEVDERGRLKITLNRVLAGRLPFPMGLFSSYRESALGLISRHMDDWRLHAAIDHTGVANSALINAVMGSLFADALNDRSADPVLFLPLVRNGSLPVRVLSVAVQDHALTLTVEPMPPEQRRALVDAVKHASPFP